MKTQLKTSMMVSRPDSESITMVSNNVYIVKSQTREGKFYTVRKINNADIWTCACPDFNHKLKIFADDTRCKHILLAEIYQSSTDCGLLSYPPSPSPICTFSPRPKICTECGTTNIKKSGFRKTINGSNRQRFTCLQCGFRFILGENGFRKLKADPDIITEVLNLILNGMSSRGIAEHLKITRQLRISHQTVNNWFKKYMKLINDFVSFTLPRYTSQYWCLDEMVVNVKGTTKNGFGYYVWLWTIIDPKTRFIIASEISKKREIADARNVISKAKHSTTKKPNYVITDSLPAYTKALLSEFDEKILHVKTKSFADGFQNRPIERYHNEIRSVIKTKRGLGNDKSTQEFAEHYKTYHNFIRPHSGLPDNITPAEACGIDLKLGENKMAGILRKAMKFKYNFETQLRKRIQYVNIYYEEDCTRVAPKGIIKKQKWREINDILRLNGFVWLSNGRESCWIRS